jgi:long-subunit fatty acid transport protein
MKRVFIIFFFYSFLCAQDADRIPLTVNLVRFPETLTILNLTSSGISFLANSQVADVTNGNPAALGRFQNLSAGLSWQFESDLTGPDIMDLVLKRDRVWLPQSAGIVYPFNELLRFALGLNRRYSNLCEYTFELITPEMPMGTSEFFKAGIESSVITYSVIAGYTFQEFLSAQRMTLALRYNLDYMSTTEEMLDITAKASGFDFSWAVGIIADFKLPECIFSFGASYEKDLDIEEKMEFDSKRSIVVPDQNLNTDVLLQSEATPIVTRIPARLNFGTSITFKNIFIVEVSLSQVFWSEISGSFNDVIEYAAFISRPFLPCLTTSIGIYSTGLNYNYTSIIDEPDALYLTAGVRLSFEKFRIDLVLADDHFSSIERREQTIVKVSGSFIF